ncbi:MAG: hypothetical protein RLZZ141_458 [Pseudomonadota bacterium]|jgi:hypothetical protein
MDRTEPSLWCGPVLISILILLSTAACRPQPNPPNVVPPKAKAAPKSAQAPEASRPTRLDPNHGPPPRSDPQ